MTPRGQAASGAVLDRRVEEQTPRQSRADVSARVMARVLCAVCDVCWREETAQ